MKKKYIILGPITYVGGAQIYINNQCNYVQSKGWIPIVLYSTKSPGKVELTDLKTYENNRIIELRYSPSLFSNVRIRKVINRMLELIDYSDDEEYFIQSSNVNYALWGELLAKTIKCKHFIFVLDAFFDYVRDIDYIEFMKFKLKRNELCGTRKGSLQDLFGSDYILQNGEDFYLEASCINTVAPVEYKEPFDFSSFDLCIGHVGRDEKPYVETIPNQIENFLMACPEKKILLYMIGGNHNSSIGMILDKVEEKYANFKVAYTGYIYPIPESLINKMDLLIGSSGCIWAVVDYGIPVIGYFDNNPNPLGVIGYDIRKYPIEKSFDGSLSQLLIEVTEKHYLEKYSYRNLFIKKDNKEYLEYDYNRIIGKDYIPGYYNTVTISVEKKNFFVSAFTKTIGRIVSLYDILILYRKFILRKEQVYY